MTEDDEVVKCHQCAWPILRAQAYVISVKWCPVHGAWEQACFHADLCLMAYAVDEDRPTTQKRRAAMMRMN